jgi:hypothetical protein
MMFTPPPPSEGAIGIAAVSMNTGQPPNDDDEMMLT